MFYDGGELPLVKARPDFLLKMFKLYIEIIETMKNRYIFPVDFKFLKLKLIKWS